MSISINSDLEARQRGGNILYPLSAFVHTKLSVTVRDGCKYLKQKMLLREPISVTMCYCTKKELGV